MLVRCRACKGAKKATGLGGIIGDCRVCDGKGMHEPVAITQSVVKGETIGEAQAKAEEVKKRGRPFKSAQTEAVANG